MSNAHDASAEIDDDELPGLHFRAIAADQREKVVLRSRCAMTLRRDRSRLKVARLRGLAVDLPLLVLFFGLAVGAGLLVNHLFPGWPILAWAGCLVAMGFLVFLFNDSPTLRSNTVSRDAEQERLERRIAEVSATLRLLRERPN